LNNASFHALGLTPELLRALDEEGYTQPTPIQQEAIPLVLTGRDLVGSAQTGTGKTAAFILPILQRLKNGRRGTLRALILVPTRELAEQVVTSAKAYGRHTGLTSVAFYGGTTLGPQIKALSRGLDIAIATPGRLLDLMERRHVNTSKIEVLVLDEADRMLDMGFAPDVSRILGTLPPKRQTLLFSATMSPDVSRLARQAMKDHAAVEIGRGGSAADNIEHVLVTVDKTEKRQALSKILTELPRGRTLIFTRTKHGADRLAKQLRTTGTHVAALHGGKTQRARNTALESFRNGKVPILVATDVAARGIDVDNIAMVVNFDVPREPEVYVHRVGRTARAGAEGVALTLMSSDEWLHMSDVEHLIGRTFPREVLPGFEPTTPAVVAAAPARQRERVAPRHPSVGPRRGGARRR
jgi:ATP-dependent RNA helicase RhlE